MLSTYNITCFCSPKKKTCFCCPKKKTCLISPFPRLKYRHICPCFLPKVLNKLGFTHSIIMLQYNNMSLALQNNRNVAKTMLSGSYVTRKLIKHMSFFFQKLFLYFSWLANSCNFINFY